MDAINIRGLVKQHKHFVQRLTRALDLSLERSTELAEQHVRRYSKFKQRSVRSLKNTTETRVVRTARGRVVSIKSPKRYASFVEFGTRPHIIRARKSKFLVFRGRSGALVFRRSVKHPGTKPTHFLWNATNAAYRFSIQDMTERAGRLAKEF